MITAGIDSGSRAVKCVLWDAAAGRIVGSSVIDAGLDAAASASLALARAGGPAPDVICATGYGRAQVAARHRVTEITCHARGVHQRLPQAASVIEIGGQDSKALRLGPHGAVADFAMNDRCAAGTGRFLEVVAARLGTDLEGLGRLAGEARQATAISSMCVVFAESEIIGLIASGTAPADIVAGVFHACATRIHALAGRLLAAPVAFTGGVARLPGMAQAMERACGLPVIVPQDPQLTGALGAALIAAERG